MYELSDANRRLGHGKAEEVYCQRDFSARSWFWSWCRLRIWRWRTSRRIPLKVLQSSQSMRRILSIMLSPNIVTVQIFLSFLNIRNVRFLMLLIGLSFRLASLSLLDAWSRMIVSGLGIDAIPRNPSMVLENAAHVE
jgi:hypothetical protein